MYKYFIQFLLFFPPSEWYNIYMMIEMIATLLCWIEDALEFLWELSKAIVSILPYIALYIVFLYVMFRMEVNLEPGAYKILFVLGLV